MDQIVSVITRDVVDQLIKDYDDKVADMTMTTIYKMNRLRSFIIFKVELGAPTQRQLRSVLLEVKIQQKSIQVIKRKIEDHYITISKLEALRDTLPIIHHWAYTPCR